MTKISYCIILIVVAIYLTLPSCSANTKVNNMIPNYPNWSDSTIEGVIDAPAFTGDMAGIPQPAIVAVGPEILDQATTAVNVRYYALHYSTGNLYLQRAADDAVNWEAIIDLGTIPGEPDGIALAFNGKGEAVVFYEIAGEIFHFDHKNAGAVVKIADGGSIIAEMDYATAADKINANVMIAYVRQEGIYYKLDFDDYVKEDVIPIPAGSTEVSLLGIGIRTDRRLQVQFSYLPAAVVGIPSDHVRAYSFEALPAVDANGNAPITSTNELAPALFGLGLVSDGLGRPDCTEWFHDGAAADDFSVSFWIKVVVDGALLFYSGGGSLFHFTGGDIKGFSTIDYNIDNGYVVGEWLHVVMTRTGTDLHVYLDTVDNHFPTSSGYPRVGSWTNEDGGGSDEYIMDNLRSYDRVLTAEEVAALFNEPRPEAPEAPVYDAYTVGDWKWLDSGSENYWTAKQWETKDNAVVWDNGDAQISMLAHNTYDPNGAHGSTSRDGFEWTVTVPDDSSWGTTGWFGFAVGKYAGLGDGSVKLNDEYDIFVDFIVDGVTKTYFLQPDTAGGNFKQLRMYEVIDDQGTLAGSYLALSGQRSEWSYGQLAPYVDGATEFIIYNFDMFEFEEKIFPGKFTDYNGYATIGTVECIVRVEQKAATAPSFQGYMKFIFAPST